MIDATLSLINRVRDTNQIRARYVNLRERTRTTCWCTCNARQRISWTREQAMGMRGLPKVRFAKLSKECVGGRTKQPRLANKESRGPNYAVQVHPLRKAWEFQTFPIGCAGLWHRDL